MNPDEIRELTEAELDEQLRQREQELFRLRYRAAYQELENPALIGRLRKDIARIKTIRRERELEAERTGESDE